MTDGISFVDVNGWSVLLTVALVVVMTLFLRWATEAQAQRIVQAAMKSAVASASGIAARVQGIERRMADFEQEYRETRERVRVLEARFPLFRNGG